MAMKRLYIGGLGHTVSEKDLKDRFGKFGDVSDVEIITRKDENGAPLKTFGYININITDAEYKRCVGILNKSTWKGGTLLIQLAKESFLHKLAEERQQLVESAKTPKIIPQEKLVDSLKAAGIENFHMKAAVPGTEIPGHKNWVVSKFGRVLPVLNLGSKGKKVFKYDPSKHCHNIKRLETADDVTSVSKLTWEIEGGDDEMSKKRRGEFPEQKSCPKRPKIDARLFLSNLAQRNGIPAAAIENKNNMSIQQNGLSATRTVKQKSVCVLRNDDDSEDEIRMLVAQELLRNSKQTSTVEDDDNLEVVGDGFIVKSNVFWGGAEQDGVKKPLTSSKDDEEYDSADTDEILTQRKTQKTQVGSAPASQDSLTKSNTNKSSSESVDGSDEASDEDDGDVSVDTDYEALMGNCYRLDLSLADLEQLAKNAEVISDDENVEEPKTPPKRKGNNPEDILASLLGDDTPEKESKKKRKKNQVKAVSLPAFVGTKDLFEGPEPSLKRVAQSTDCESPKRLKQDVRLKEQSVSEDTSIKSSNRPLKLKNKASTSGDDSSEESERSGNEDAFTSKTSSASQTVRTMLESKLKTVSSNTQAKAKQMKTSRSSEESESSEEEDNAKVVTSKTSSVTQSVKSIPKTEMKTVSSNESKTSVKCDSSSQESESSEEDDDAKVLTSKTSSASQLTKNIPKTKVKTVSSNNSIKPKQMKTSSSSSSDSSSEESESSEEENKKDSAEVCTSKISSATQSVKTISKTEIKTLSSNKSKTPVKPKQTKTSRSSSSDSSSEESESSEETDNAKVSISKTSSATQPARTIPETEVKTVCSNTSFKPKQRKTSKSSSSDSSSEESESSEEEDNAKVLTSKTSSDIPETELKTVRSNSSIKPKQTKPSRSSSSDSSSEESESSGEEDNAKVSKTSSVTQSARTISETKVKTVSSSDSIKSKQTSKSSCSHSSSEESETSDDEKSRTQTLKNGQEKVVSHPDGVYSTVVDAQKQQQDNQKRLAALKQRQKETEQQKKLIQGALSKVDAGKENKSKHIVFDSDEEEDETTSRPEAQRTNVKKSLFEGDSGSDEDQQMSMSIEKKNNKPGGSKLFDSEDEDDDPEDDRFQIKPQFEGKAGQKLMQLQARFGTDSRFQVDSRFLESDEEAEDQDAVAPEKDEDEQLLEEKKKSLDILQSILKTNIQPQNTRKGKMFKDVSSLHYDPTQEEHVTFETKTEEPKKESKAEKRKKHIEAEKLPEVSKDIYFDVSVDFKEVFGTTKENEEEKETVFWDKEAEETEDIIKPMEVSFTSNVEAKEDTSGGFKFSFFGEDTVAETTNKTDEYNIETLKGAKFSWQVDPRFQDSSSDEEGVDEDEEDQTASSKITEEPTTSKKVFFFFFQDDERLKDGPGMFCRSVKLQDQRETWEEKRTVLKEECRKKHRDAKRRQRPSLKT
ncbi:nucleolar protein 8 [Garra rufa]|uniref:nucleolar protein 8 n=1 Tax=Garra rufa TaxID=137080 RepID=UPI003CCE5983